MFYYSVHGVSLDCDTDLPELDALRLAQERGECWIKVRLSNTNGDHPLSASWFSRSALANGNAAVLCGKLDAGYLLRYAGLADFMLDDAGSEVQCIRAHPDIAPQTLRHLLLDRVLPLALNLRGYHVIHATAIATPAGVCAFIGPSGAGKSTLAASFAANGHSIFCDDCLVVRIERGIFCMPGYPGLRLWQDSFSALASHFIRASDATFSLSKFRVSTNSQLLPGPLHRLKAIFRINRLPYGRPADVCVQRLTGSEAFVELASSAYLLDVTQPDTLRRHFRFVERVLGEIPLNTLLLPTDFACLPAARQLIVNEVERA